MKVNPLFSKDDFRELGIKAEDIRREYLASFIVIYCIALFMATIVVWTIYTLIKG